MDQNILYTSADLPEGEALAGQFLNVGNDATHYRSSYRVAHVSKVDGLTAIHLAPTTLILGRGHLDAAPPDDKTLPNVVPLEYAKTAARRDSEFFAGKTVATPDGRAATRITGVEKSGTTIRVSDATGFQAGDDLVIHDVRAGDTFRMPCWVRLARAGFGQWTVEGNVPASVDVAGEVKVNTPPRR